MLVVELIYKNIAEIDKYLQAHRAFLQKYYDNGSLIASGPKEPRTGGIILACVDEARMQEIIREDPFYQHQLAEYHITVFHPIKYCAELSEKIQKSQTKSGQN